MSRRLIQTCVYGALLLFGLWGVIRLLSLPVVANQLPADVLTSVRSSDRYLLWAAVAFLLGIPLYFIATIIAIVFFPVVFRERRASIYDWLRTFCLTGGFVFFLAYHFAKWTFVPGLGAVHASVARANEGRLPVPLLTVGVSLAEATTVFLGVALLATAIEFAFHCWRRTFRALESLISQVDNVWNVLKPSRRADDSTANQWTEHALYACVLLNFILFVLACYPLLSVEIAVIPLVAGFLAVERIRSYSDAPGRQTTKKDAWSIFIPGILTVFGALAIYFLFPNNGGGSTPQGIGLLPTSQRDLWLALMRSVFLHVAIAFLGLRFFDRVLLSNWASAIGPDYTEKCLARLAWTVAVYFGFKGGLILLCYAACFAAERNTAPNIANNNPPVEFSAFAYMAWTGSVLMSDEYLYTAQTSNGQEPNNREEFKEQAKQYRGYFAPFFVCIVVIQAVLGWNFGIHLGCYMCFTYAWYVFKYPRPEEGVTPETYTNERRKTGSVERVRETSEAMTVLGFIGTLVGLSQAIFFLGNPSPVQELTRASGISGLLAASLGTAFFTTFVAMALRLLLQMRFAQLAGESLSYQRLFQFLNSGK
jgi:hypothetical protein